VLRTALTCIVVAGRCRFCDDGSLRSIACTGGATGSGTCDGSASGTAATSGGSGCNTCTSSTAATSGGNGTGAATGSGTCTGSASGTAATSGGNGGCGCSTCAGDDQSNDDCEAKHGFLNSCSSNFEQQSIWSMSLQMCSEAYVLLRLTNNGSLG
jgi:hypothetical protein